MANDDPRTDPFIWTGKEHSGHRLAVVTPLEDTGPWSTTAPGSGRRSWLFVGLRERSGIIDVARVDGPMFTAGVTRPQDGALLPQQAALLIAQAVGSDTEMARKGPVGAFLSRAVGVEQGIEDTGITVHPMPSRAARGAALDRMDPGHAALFAAAVHGHHRLASLVAQFEGPARTADVRAPGAIDALNLANGVVQGPSGRLHADPEGPWTRHPNRLPVLEIAAAQGKIEPLFAATTEADARTALAASLAGQTMSNTVEDPARRVRLVGLVNDVAGAPNADPRTRLTIAQHAGLLSLREEPTATWLEPSGKPPGLTGPVSKADTLAAATRMAFDVDQANGGWTVAQVSLTRAPLSTIDKTGGQMLDMEERMGHGPIAQVARKVATSVVAPAVAAHEQAIPGLDANPLWKEATTPDATGRRAAAITVGNGVLSFGAIPLQVSNTLEGANAVAKGQPDAWERFQTLNLRDASDHVFNAQRSVLPKAARDVVEDPKKMVRTRPDDQGQQ